MFSRHSDRPMRDAGPVGTDPSRNGALSPVPTVPVRDAEPAVTAVALTIGSVVGRDDMLDGAIRVRQALRIFGRVTGSIESESSITIEEGAVVEADITATEVTICGSYSGKRPGGVGWCGPRGPGTGPARCAPGRNLWTGYRHGGGVF